MAIPLHVLLVEDNPYDAELILYELRRAGFDPDSQRVETKSNFLAALDQKLDLILADYRLPQFDGLSALELLVERGLDIPFILISGAIGEELAVTAIKRGATDYLLKDRLGRLGAAVEQALKNRAAQQESRAAANALQESDERLRIALKNSPIVVFNQDRDLRYTWIHNPNPGFRPQEVLGKSDADRFSPPEADRLTEIKQRVLETGVALRGEVTLTIQGRTLTYDLSVEPQRDAHANIIGVTGVSVDITERKEGKIELVRLRKAVEASGEVIFLTDRTGLITFVNPEFTHQYGYTAEEVVGKVTPRILRSGTMKTEAYSLFWQTLLNKQTIQREMINKTKDGRLLTMEVSVNPVLDELGEIDGFLAIQRDITERKRSEKLTHARLALFEYSATHGLKEVLQETLDQADALTSSPIGFYHFVSEDQNSLSLQAWSTSTLADYCHAEGEGLHYSIDQAGVWADCVYTRKPVVHNDYANLPHRKGLPENHAELIRELVVPILREDKVVAILGVGNKPTDYTENDVTLVTYFANVAWEIAEQKRAEAERERLMAQIRVQAKQMEQVLATVPSGVLMLDMDGRVLQANPVAQKDLVLLAEAKVGEIITGLGDRALVDLLTSPSAKGLWHEIQTDHRIFEAMIRPVETGSMTEHWVLVLNEITQAREIQTQLQQQERLASVGQLAAGIAHDFNNIMAVIVLYAQMVARSEQIGDRNREKMETINQQAWHASRLIQQLLDFSRRAVLQRQSLDLLPLLKEQVKLLKRTLPEDMVLRLDYEQEEYMINADPTRIQQMITNLAINARDAMPTGGTLHMDLSRMEIRAIDAAQAPVPGTAVGLGVGVGEGEWIKLTLKDTGIGIPPNILPHIFDPFFTTKQVGSGTGLGLAQVHGIVGQHGGHIAVESIVGQGTTFTIHLPALPPHPQETARIVDISAIPQGHGELLLVVEDQEFVRNAVVATLEMFGYQTIEAGNGKEALEIMQHRGDEVALILSDVVMPVMGGIAFFHTLREQAWTTPFIMLTGHPLDNDFRTLHKEGLSAWLPKPPDLEQLAQAIAQALSGRN